jgi:hypothetical protein
VLFAGGGLVIEDAGSATGTFVNGEKVEGQRSLQEGDRVCLGPPGAKGSAKLVVRLPGGASPALAADAAAPALSDAQAMAPAFDEAPSAGEEEPALAFAGQAAWAPALSAASSAGVKVLQAIRISSDVLAPVVSALRVQIIVAAAAVGIPLTLALSRLAAPRQGQVA